MTTKGRLEVCLYHNTIRRYIHLEPDLEPTFTVRAAFPTFRYQQADAVIRGIDAWFIHRLLPSWELTGSAALVRGQNTDTDTPLFLMPSDRFELATRYQFLNSPCYPNTYFRLRGSFVRKQDRTLDDHDYAASPPGYILLDIDLGTTLILGSLYPQVNLSIRNVLNSAYRDYLSRYRYFVDDSGRNVVLRITIPFGKDED